jgi:LmbE family N-acetylglucosaminyl deacetylase
MSVVVFGPHTDDAIFSIGAYLAALDDEVTIVSPMAGIPEDEAGRDKHMRLRAEHEQACQLIGARAVNGPYLDDVYAAPSRNDVSEWLGAHLLDQDAAYIPFGIHHPDHLMVSNLVLDLIRLSPGIPPRLCFYEELPYRINNPEIANARFAHIENNIGRLRLVEQTYPTEPKEQAVRAYASQITGETGIDKVLLGKLLSRERIWELVR